MAQVLILEGNEGYVLSEILKRSKAKLPLGYPTKEEYIKEFLESVNGIKNVRKTLIRQLQEPKVTNIGIIVDANSAGAQARFRSIKDVLERQIPEVANWRFTQEAPSGWALDALPNLRIGLWVMPNNRDNGYFEHFLLELIDPNDESLRLAEKLLQEAVDSGSTRFPALRRQKALLAIFLALQEEPGMQPTTAVKKGLIRHDSPLARHFVSWYENTFRFD